MSWTLKPLTREHISAAAALFNQSVADGEMIFSPLDEAVFERRFFQPGAHAFAAEENGELIGFIHGACKTAFLNKENNENTPGYLSVVVVRKDKRRQGVGSALVAALEDAFDIMIDMDDIIDLSSFEKGKEILKKYDVEL